LKLAQANNCSDALPKLERAEKLYHSAVVASRLGECYVNVGRLVEGTEVLRKVLREPQPADATPALVKALDRAQRTLDAAKPRIAGLTIKIAAVQDMRVKLDGNIVPSALLESEVPTDPGEHNIEATAPGFLRSATRVSVGEGEKRSVSLTLSRDPNAAATAPPAAEAVNGQAAAARAKSSAEPEQSALAPATPAAAREPNRTAAYASLGIGVAGIVTGGVLGFMAIGEGKDLRNQCPNDVCPADQQAAIDSAKRLGNFSTVAFSVGGAGLLLGTVLFFTASPSNVDRAQPRAKPRFAGLSQPRLAVGPTQIQLGADF
jgi:pyruvate/2-oxoglutarate dehydrogenase complex dihydrolipoamide acyltransferase (E2) component